MSTATDRASSPPRIDPRLRQRRVAVTRQRGRRRLRWLGAGLVVAVAGAGSLVVLHSPLLSARHVTVIGSPHTPEATVEAVAGLAGHPALVDVDPAACSKRLEALPWVARAELTVHWPDSVTVTIAERVPVAVLRLASGGFALVDRTGRVLADTPQAPPATPSLEVPGSAGPPGSDLGTGALPALEVAQELPSSLRAEVSTVASGASGTVTLDLDGGITATLGPTTEIPAKLDALASLLARAPIEAPAAIDLTVPGEPTVTLGPAQRPG